MYQSEAVDVLLGIVKRIKSAEFSNDDVSGLLETECFQATLEMYMRKGRLESLFYGVFEEYLVEFSGKFYK